MHAPNHPILVRTLRGLEWIAGAEVQATLRPPRIEHGHRELRFSVPELTDELTSLGTVDDVFLVAATLDAVDRRRESLQRLGTAKLDLDAYAALLAALAAASGWTYLSRSGGRPARGELSLRVHAVDSEATIAVRIAPAPLHRRGYRVASRPGALHPPLARALGLLAGLRVGLTLADPFCGTGTIPVEAKLACPELQASGSDLDPEAVEAARRNAEAAGVDLELAVRDASDLPAADRVATNPPWESAVRMAGSGTLPLDGVERAVVLAPPERTLDRVALETRVRVSGAIAAISVVADEPIDADGLYGRELSEAQALPALWSWA